MQGFRLVNAIPNYTQVPVGSSQEIDRLLIEADHTLLNSRRSAAIISVAIHRILGGNPKYSMRYIESRFRAIDSATYLLAVPTIHAPINTVSRMVWTTNPKPTEYFLWVCVNGAEEVKRHAAQFGIDLETNPAQLDVTGMLTIDQTENHEKKSLTANTGLG